MRRGQGKDLFNVLCKHQQTMTQTLNQHFISPFGRSPQQRDSDSLPVERERLSSLRQMATCWCGWGRAAEPWVVRHVWLEAERMRWRWRVEGTPLHRHHPGLWSYLPSRQEPPPSKMLVTSAFGKYKQGEFWSPQAQSTGSQKPRNSQYSVQTTNVTREMVIQGQRNRQ